MKQLFSLKSIRIFTICWIAYSLVASAGIYFLFATIASFIPDSMESIKGSMNTFLLALTGICWIGFAANIFMLLYGCLIADLLVRYKKEQPQQDLFFKTFAFLYLGQVAGSTIITALAKEDLENMLLQSNNPGVIFDWIGSNANAMIICGLAGTLLAGIAVFLFYKGKGQISEDIL